MLQVESGSDETNGSGSLSPVKNELFYLDPVLFFSRVGSGSGQRQYGSETLDCGLFGCKAMLSISYSLALAKSEYRVDHSLNALSIGEKNGFDK